MPKTGPKLAALTLALSILGMLAQLALRLVFSSRLGASAEYDAFLIASMPASLIATVAFQALASALIPTIAASLEAQRPGEARSIYINASRSSLLFSTVLSLLIALIVTLTHGPELGLIWALVLSAWGVLAGQSVLQRQLLIFTGTPLRAAILALTPALTTLALASILQLQSLTALCLAGALGQALASLLGHIQTQKHWSKITPAGPTAPSWTSLRLLILGAAPIFAASINAQAMAWIDQTCAAFWQVGGLSLLSLALAVSRLPQVLGDALMQNLSYASLIRAAASFKANPQDPGRAALLQKIINQMLQVQAFLAAPAAALLLVASDDLAITLYCRGKLSLDDALRVAQLLRWTAPCVLITAWQSAQVTALVALGLARLALRAELLLTIASAALNLLFLPSLGLPGLLLSTAISSALINHVLTKTLQNQFGSQPQHPVNLYKILIAAAASGIIGLTTQFLIEVAGPGRLAITFLTMTIGYIGSLVIQGGLNSLIQETKPATLPSN